jgi:RNA polymerase sigma factor (sigma-70 family)
MMPDIKHISDEELYELLYGSDNISRLAFEELYQRYSSKLYTYCRRILGNNETAEDVFQEAFIKFYESSKVQRVMTNVGGYLTKIARNLCLNEKQRKTQQIISFEELKYPVFAEGNEKNEIKNLMETAFEIMPDDYREVLVLKEFMGFSYKEIAEITNCSLSVVRTRIWRAKNRLRKIITPLMEDFQE